MVVEGGLVGVRMLVALSGLWVVGKGNVVAPEGCADLWALRVRWLEGGGG